MKTLGILGGMSWHSTIDFYRYINQMVNEKLGENHSAKCLIYSLDFNEITACLPTNNYESVAKLIINGCQKLEAAKCDAIVLGSNTAYYFYEQAKNAINTPIIHIADATAHEIKKHNMTKVALLGTKLTMGEGFYKDILGKKGIEPIVPQGDDFNFLHEVIINELTAGNFYDSTRIRIIEIIEKLIKQGAQGIVLGCTELPLIIKPEHVSVPVFDTTLIHAQASVEFMLN